MTAYLAGVVQVRCTDHLKASDIDGVVRAVLAAMAYPARDARSKCSDSQRYLCTEPVSKIAERCGFDRKVVMRAQKRAAELELITCVKAEPKKPKHWRIKIVMGEDMSLSGTTEPTEDMSPRGTSQQQGMSPRGTRHVPERDQTCPPEGHNPEESPGAFAEGDDDAAADASAPDVGSAATSASAAPARASAQTIAEIAELDGCTIERTEQWAGYIQSRAKIRRNPDRYLFTCQENGNGPASWSPPGPSAGQRSATGKGSAESAEDTTSRRTFSISMRPPAGAIRPPKITVRPNS